MRPILLALALSVVSPIALAGNGYTCFMPKPPFYSDLESTEHTITYSIYDGTQSQDTKTALQETFRSLVSDHEPFFAWRRPELHFSNDLQDFLAVLERNTTSNAWTTAIVVGDKRAAKLLHTAGYSMIAFVPAEKDISPAIIEKIFLETNMPYYSIASDHAFRRVTRMAAGLDISALSEVTVDHIIADAIIEADQ